MSNGKESQTQCTKQKAILIIEDHANIAASTKSLTIQKHSIIRTNSCTEALQHFQHSNKHITVVILDRDIHANKKQAFLASPYTVQNKNTITLLCTAHYTEAAVHKANWIYIHKPLTEAILQHYIQKIIQSHNKLIAQERYANFCKHISKKLQEELLETKQRRLPPHKHSTKKTEKNLNTLLDSQNMLLEHIESIYQNFNQLTSSTLKSRLLTLQRTVQRLHELTQAEIFYQHLINWQADNEQQKDTHNRRHKSGPSITQRSY